MKIEFTFKEGTTIVDTSKDNVVITMTADELTDLQFVIDIVRLEWKASKKSIEIAKQLDKKIKQAREQRKIKWVK